MYSLLPERYIKNLRREYRLRLAATCLFFLTAAFAIGMVSLLPSYILSRGQESQAVTELDSLKKASAASGVDKAGQDVIALQSMISSLGNHQDAKPLSGVVEKIISHRPQSVILGTFDVSRDASSTATVLISGIALARESLISFKKELGNDPSFIKVEFPVSDLAKGHDIHFNMKVKVKI
ncbi:MAG: seg [Candidatus Taylorbacteria bacterium]|nr:seg [Candidatus Taylorbacteria bacterium]